MTVSLLHEVKQNWEKLEKYMSKNYQFIDKMIEEMSHRVREIESLSAVSKKYVTTPDTSVSSIKAKNII